MKKRMKKILKKALNITMRTITWTAVILLIIFSCAVEMEKTGFIICGCCVAWLGLVGLFAWLEYKYGI